MDIEFDKTPRNYAVYSESIQVMDLDCFITIYDSGRIKSTTRKMGDTIVKVFYSDLEKPSYYINLPQVKHPKGLESYCGPMTEVRIIYPNEMKVYLTYSNGQVKDTIMYSRVGDEYVRRYEPPMYSNFNHRRWSKAKRYEEEDDPWCIPDRNRNFENQITSKSDKSKSRKNYGLSKLAMNKLKLIEDYSSNKKKIEEVIDLL